MTAAPRRRTAERGAVAVELVALAPVLILATWLVAVFALRLMLADAQVDAAARDAARAASIARSSLAARTAAAQAATAALAEAKPQCRRIETSINGREFAPGRSVQVSVHCSIRLEDLGLLGLRTTRMVSATYLAPVDEFRGVGP